MSEKTDKFINTIGTLAKNEYMSREKWVLPSVCIAQAALESGWNLQAKTLFGIKGAGFTATTSEYYNGERVQIEASFREYPTIASAVVGYFDFLRDTPRYAKVLNNPDYKDAVDKLIHTTDGCPYATDPDYIRKVCSIIEQYGLTSWDTRTTSSSNASPLLSVDDIAKEVIAGKWGNGAERKNALESSGYDYTKVQNRVNEILTGKTTITAGTKVVLNNTPVYASSTGNTVGTRTGTYYINIAETVHDRIRVTSRPEYVGDVAKTSFWIDCKPNLSL